jgi:hypothetical protein
MKLEKVDDNRLELYNFETNAVYWQTDVDYVLLVRFVYVSFVTIVLVR